MPKITEQAIGKAVLEILATCPDGTASIRALKKRIPDVLRLSDEDRKKSLTRRNEELWEQQVRNLVSHREVEGNIVCEGLAEYRPGYLTITKAGRSHIRNGRG